jgi:hypothetical protein
MKALARALINAAAFLELSDDKAINPELAVQALEEIALHLSECSEEERKVLADVLAEMRANELETGPRPEVLAFLDSFLVSFGLVDETDFPDPAPPPRINLL